MSDIMYRDSSQRLYIYNHGYKGWCYYQATFLNCYVDQGPIPQIRGSNQLYGDGHVVWKKRAAFPHLDLMGKLSIYPDGAVTSTAGGDADFYAPF